MKFKLPCMHKRMQYLEKFVTDKPYKCQCMDCEKIIYRKKEIPHRKHDRTNYSWCDCGNDLIRDSFKGEVKGIVPDLTVYRYVCSSCTRESFWTFDIGLGAVCLIFDDNGKVKEYL